MREPYGLSSATSLSIQDSIASRITGDVQQCAIGELLAAVIGGQNASDAANDLLSAFGNAANMMSASVAEIASASRHIRKNVALRIKSALALGAKVVQSSPETNIINAPADAVPFLLPLLSNQPQERFVLLSMGTRNNVLAADLIYIGTVDNATVRSCEVIRAAIKRNAVRMIAAHNHPSGIPDPSPADIALTKALSQAGKLMDIDLLDHVIIGTASNWCSIKSGGHYGCFD